MEQVKARGEKRQRRTSYSVYRCIQYIYLAEIGRSWTLPPGTTFLF